MKRHQLTLLSGREDELRISASLLQEALSALIDGARSATRFAIEGVSVRKGPKPEWLEAACHVDVTGLVKGSARLELEAPTLDESGAWSLLGGPTLFDDPKRGTQDKTAIDLLGEVLAAFVEGRLEDVVADRALLDSCVRLVKADPCGVKIEGISGRSQPLVLQPEHASQIEQLRDKTPPNEATRVSGVLDTISESRPDIILSVGGVRVPARLREHDAELLHRLFRRQVVVSGTARFRPSGKLLSIEVVTIQAATDKDQIFATLPEPRSQTPLFLPAHRAKTDVSAFFATWPGEETEEELLLALKDL